MPTVAENFQSVFPPLAYPNRTSARTAQPPLSVADIQRGICEAADLPLSRARTIPAQAYTSEEFFEWEVRHLLRGGWQCVAHLSQIPQAGDFLNLDLIGEPLIVVRGKDDVVRVLSRVCPHRAMDIMPEGFGYGGHGPAEAKAGAPACGHTRIFLCPYHAWTFELDGRLKACPEMHQADGFVRDEIGLKPFRSEVWEGFVFVNLDGQAPPFAEGLTGMAADLAAYRMRDMKLVIAREWDCPFNWKGLVENFMESYHHLGIHHKTLQPMMPARNTWTEQERRHYVRSHLPYKDEVREEYRAFEARGDFSEDLPPVTGLSEAQKSEWGLFLIHPTFLLATAPDRVIWYRLQPLGPDRLKLLTTTLVAPDVVARENFARLRDKTAQSLVDFHLEDMEVCTAVQRGLYASGWQPGRLSHLEMPVWLFHRYLAARIRGVWPTEDRPAAPSQRP
ncbi:MAG TPA: SRPBCC family protein [Opitutaceae bacterium]|jgi:phenylpropionate dioxygenase-like ring-hydroxylating dioxygenase large terminal subunit|nr:SRPBCC family protein [Opitutaceae bacterium]